MYKINFVIYYPGTDAKSFKIQQTSFSPVWYNKNFMPYVKKNLKTKGQQWTWGLISISFN